MYPGGETEATLIGQRIGLPTPELERQQSSNVKPVAFAAPLAPYAYPALIGAIGTVGILGNSMKDAWENWQNSRPEDREDAVDRVACDRMYERESEKCKNISETRGKAAGRICYESAATRYSMCLARKPEEQWPDLKD